MIETIGKNLFKKVEVKDVLFKNNENLSPDRFNSQNKFILSIGRFTRQ